jgi:hypothetical protein
MDDDLDPKFFTKVLGALCALSICVILTAGLWPFGAPKNGVAWTKGGSGLQFGHNGVVLSGKSFHADTAGNGCSVEVMLQPELKDGSGTILAFDNNPDPRLPFSLRQFGESLVIQHASVDSPGRRNRTWWKTDRIFEQGKPVLLTITSGQRETTVYADGVRKAISSDAEFVRGDLTGRLVLGNSTIRDGWSGEISGLAIYGHALAPAQVQAHFERWAHGQSPLAAADQAPTSLYLFDEHQGTVVHDRLGTSNDLVIPSHYLVLHPPFLEPTWKQFRTRWDGWLQWSYWSDACINVAGFVPLGLLFMARFSRERTTPLVRAAVCALGLGISLFIEVVQYFLPTRDSSMTDVVTNTLGTTIGVGLYRPIVVRGVLRSRFVRGTIRALCRDWRWA